MRSILGRAGALAAAAGLAVAAFAGPAFAGPAFAGPAFAGPAFAGAAFAGPAHAAAPLASSAGPVIAGLTITPSATAVGGTVTVVGTATNTSSAPVQASLGIDNPGLVAITAVSGTPGCSPRNITHLVYCGIQSLAPGATASIRLTLVPKAAGSFDFRTYARITYTTDDTYAYGTLTVS